MAELFKGLFGGSKSTATAVPAADSDFADFAEAPEPQPVSHFTRVAGGADGLLSNAAAAAATAKPYTKWYNVHERYTLADFQVEGFILGAIVVLLVFHVVGSRINRARARSWMRAHLPLLAGEFAVVGFGGVPTAAADKSGEDLAKAVEDLAAKPDAFLSEKSLFEFAAYATGRANVAFVDVKLTLKKRFNPIMSVIETGTAFFFDSFAFPTDHVEAILYPFDGKEGALVPGGMPGGMELRSGGAKSTYDGFVWALVNKDRMKQLRDDRYDVSITFTKDHPKLPVWLTVMSESAEITEALLTKELIEAAEQAGDLFDFLVVSDQPIEKPTTIDELTPHKRIFLRYRLPSSDAAYAALVPIFSSFVRLPDKLASGAHFRPEVMRKIKAVRDEAASSIKREAENEKKEERAAEKEREKKRRRDADLSGMDAKQQKKYLEKEREKELKKSMKKSTVRG